jgi:hypothetical protein
LASSLVPIFISKCQNKNLHHLANLPHLQIPTQGVVHGGISTTLETKIVYDNFPPQKQLVFNQTYLRLLNFKR